MTHTFSDELRAVQAALAAGDTAAARRLAHAAMLRAKGVDMAAEARVLACLAHCDRISSRPRRAVEAGRRAAQIFEQLGDVEGEAEALITVAHACVLLGRNEEAVEAALLSVRLSDMRAVGPLAMLAHNVLGLTFSWSGDHERGRAALETALEIARQSSPPVSPYAPLLNLMAVEAGCLLDERYQTGRLGRLDRLVAALEDCQRLERAGDNVSVLPGMAAMGRTLSAASSSLVHAWCGDLAAARAQLAAAEASLVGIAPTWLNAFACWSRAEIAWAEQAWPAAEEALVEMRAVALAVDHEQFASRAHLLLAQVYELQGKHELAHAEHRALRQRERRTVADGMGSREALVSWRLGARQNERHLRQVLNASRQFERWSLEDALTGIPNRRSFEQSLAARLASADARGAPFAVAIVDVDRFKSVNDRFTHLVGDRVLKTVAAILVAQVREGDLAARWAGDEFAILFEGATVHSAGPTCERIQAAIADFSWDSVAPGLTMSVSLGIAEAQPGDTVESLLLRSDQAMYGVKPSHSAGPVTSA